MGSTGVTGEVRGAAGPVRGAGCGADRAADPGAADGTSDHRRAAGRVPADHGRPPGRQDAADYVLSDFSSAERKELDFLVDRAADVVEAVILEAVEWPPDKYHGS